MWCVQLRCHVCRVCCAAADTYSWARYFATIATNAIKCKAIECEEIRSKHSLYSDVTGIGRVK